MAIRVDPEGIETSNLHAMIDFSGKHVLEVGAGDGRLTYRYADQAASVTGIDPNRDEILLARKECPDHLNDRVEFLVRTIEEYEPYITTPFIDIIVFSWSL